MTLVLYQTSMKLPWRGTTIRNVHLNHILKKAVASMGVAAVILTFSAPAYADVYDDQIKALKQQAAQDAANAAQYRGQADSYQAKVNELNAQISSLNRQIRANELQSAQITQQIADAEAKLSQQKAVLGDIVKTMYFDSGVSPIEMLASSSSISDFLDQEQYRESIKSKIQDTMVEIQQLQKSLDDRNKQLKGLIAEQQGQKQLAAQQQNEVNSLLALARQNAAAADAQVRNKNGEIQKLQAQQAAELAAKFGNRVIPGGTCGGGYPAVWCGSGKDTIVDKWGMYNRECVSYTAFKVWASGRNMPYWGGRGNAYQWPGNARAAGIPVDDNPRVGDVAISTAGPYGHAMYVEAVSGGRITVSQYNFANAGEYSTMTISASGLYFIHF